MRNQAKTGSSEQQFSEQDEKQLNQSIEQLNGAVEGILSEDSDREYDEYRQEIVCSLRTIASMLL